jgi:hypothetical protein
LKRKKWKVDPKSVQGMLRHREIRTTVTTCTQDDREEEQSAQGAFLSLVGLGCRPARFAPHEKRRRIENRDCEGSFYRPRRSGLQHRLRHALAVPRVRAGLPIES